MFCRDAAQGSNSYDIGGILHHTNSEGCYHARFMKGQHLPSTSSIGCSIRVRGVSPRGLLAQ